MTFESTLERIIPEQATVWDRQIHLARYAFAAPFAAGRSVLDCACGVGYGTHILAEAGARRVVGVDLAADALTYAHTRYAAPNVLFSAQDAQHLGLSGSFDLVVSFETLEHLRHPDLFLDELERVLAADGSLIISVPNKAALQISGAAPQGQLFSPYHMREYDLAEFQVILKEHFGMCEFFYQLCPDLQLLRTRQLARTLRKTGFIGIKHRLPAPVIQWLRAQRDKIGARENEQTATDYFVPRSLDVVHVPADAFVLLAVCHQPHAQNLNYHSKP